MPITSGGFHQSRETKGIGLGASGVYDHPIVTGDLTLQIQMPCYPIDHRMKEEDGLRRRSMKSGSPPMRFVSTLASGGRVARAVHHEEVRDVVSLLPLVENRRLGIVTHARRSDFVDREPRRGHLISGLDVLGAGS